MSHRPSLICHPARADDGCIDGGVTPCLEAALQAVDETAGRPSRETPARPGPRLCCAADGVLAVMESPPARRGARDAVRRWHAKALRLGHTFAFALGGGIMAVSSAARADDAPLGARPERLRRLLLDAGRPEIPAPDPDLYRFQLHGEEQLRFQMQPALPLAPTAGELARRPGVTEQALGQSYFLHHWLRLTPRLWLRDTVELVAQVDLTGVVAGELAQDTSADATPRDSRDGSSNVQPRWLYAQWRLPFGMVRIGQQPNHWGMGLLANDGDHPTLFGDYRNGAISERILFATKPGGADSDFVLAVAGDLVFRDNAARLVRGEQAYQGVLAAFYERGWNKLGVFATLRHQENHRTGASPLFRHTDGLDAAAIDLHGRVAVPVPGDPDAFITGEAEGVYVVGSTNLIRTAGQALEGAKTQISAYGGAAALGFVHARRARGERLGDGAVAFGDVVANVEIGYASGDADPYDGIQRRFVFDPNHRVGLLLFDEVLRFQTARAATAAMDPLLGDATRAAIGADLLPSNGGVFGAQYVNPTVIVRPRHWLDLKGGMVVAQATSDVVDPYRVATTGSYVNHRGGNPRRRDLGLELDAGIEARFPLATNLRLVTGAQAGLLFPGGALEDARGERLPPPWIVSLRLGLVF